MSQKRQQPEEGTSFDERRPRKSPTFKSVVLDVMNLQRLQNLMEPVLEPLIRRVVKEEVDSALRKYIISMKRNCGKDVQPSESRSLQLKFSNAISLPVFTGTRIEGEGCTSMEVALVDMLTGQVVSSGPGSSAKVEIVVLEGDFDGDERDDWTLEEFKNNIVREREGKKPLLTGDVIMTLKDGTGFIGDVLFTDNSSWTRSRKFRLGARLVDDIGGFRVREARSEPFVVRDHRGELYKKHHPPSLSDEVWRLEKIGKDGAFHKRLRKERVNTVQDFLLLLFLDPTRLRNILGTGMSAKMWEVTVEHARTCVLDKKLYLYNTTQKNAVVFNVVGQLMGISSNGHYVPVDKLSEAEKAEARQIVISAFADREKIITIDDESSLNMPTSSSLSIFQSSSNLPSEAGCHQALNSHKIGRSTYLQQNASSPDYTPSVYSIGGLSSFDDCLQGVDPMDIRYDQHLSYPGPVDSLICDADAMDTTFCANEHLQYFDTDCSIQSSNMELSADVQSAINAFIPCSSVPNDKTQSGWNDIVGKDVPRNSYHNVITLPIKRCCPTGDRVQFSGEAEGICSCSPITRYTVNPINACGIHVFPASDGFDEAASKKLRPENVPVLLPGLPPLGHEDMPSFLTEPPYIYLTAIMETFASLDQTILFFPTRFRSSKMSFLWVVGEHENKTLPSEFLDRLDSRVGQLGPWCNQVDVLAHRAMGCFLIHCGWNSTLDVLNLGLPLAAVPQWSDQPMNAKFVEEVWRVEVRAKKDGGGIVRK
ncbi:Calmodulin-binding protein 60 A [Sesamum alatum]|uniref:Calmodulin-binding protein 60 A n=1 Tax=Sesamum alatum TaxID=300844 RepID=A0AAE1YW23_9LAMI|nr:Calmodulin-binding protein 60 A [Sesamum alatum]